MIVFVICFILQAIHHSLAPTWEWHLTVSVICLLLLYDLLSNREVIDVSGVDKLPICMYYWSGPKINGLEC